MIAESCPKLLTIGGDSFNNFLKKDDFTSWAVLSFSKKELAGKDRVYWAFGSEVLKNQKNY